MENYTGQRKINLEEGKKIIGLKSTAYKEYLAARHLLNDNFLHQAAFFINTCIEKEFKAYLFALNVDVTVKHNTFKLYNILKSHKPNIEKKLNPDFLKIISKIYESRYYEDLGTRYNFVIIKNKFLAELDYTYSFLEPLSRFKLGRDKQIPKTNFDIDKEQHNIFLYRNNYLLNKIDKSKFLNQSDVVYEFRIVFTHQIIEVKYEIPFNKEHNKFIYEGLKPDSNRKTFYISNHHAEIALP